MSQGAGGAVHGERGADRVLAGVHHRADRRHPGMHPAAQQLDDVGWLNMQCTPSRATAVLGLCLHVLAWCLTAEGLLYDSDTYAEQPAHATSLPWTPAAAAAQRASADEATASRAPGRCGSRRATARRRARPRARAGAAADALHRRAARVRQGVRRSAGAAGGADRYRARPLPPGLLLQAARAAARRAVGHRARSPNAARTPRRRSPGRASMVLCCSLPCARGACVNLASAMRSAGSALWRALGCCRALSPAGLETALLDAIAGLYAMHKRMEALSSCLSGQTGVRTHADAGTRQACPLADKVVFYKVKDKLGGRTRLMISGGAPLARHVEDFLKARARARWPQRAAGHIYPCVARGGLLRKVALGRARRVIAVRGCCASRHRAGLVAMCTAWPVPARARAGWQPRARSQRSWAPLDVQCARAGGHVRARRAGLRPV